MSVEVAGLREAQQADLALVGLLAGVDAQVLGERRAVGERLLAEPAAVRALSGVRPEVGRHRRALRETALADRAAERLVAAVCPDVRRQVGRLQCTTTQSLFILLTLTLERIPSPPFPSPLSFFPTPYK